MSTNPFASSQPAITPLPKAQEVRELLENLVGRNIELLTGGPMVDPAGPGGAVVAEFVSDSFALNALVVMDVPAAAHISAALALIPAAVSAEAAQQGELTDLFLEATHEVCNVISALFNKEGAPHLRLGTVHPPQTELPNDISSWVMAYVARLDLELEVTGYGQGNLSILVL
ncbi:hypothetical protein V5R04_02735 [Jonesiaceae bacterium BS-20]|uniref:Chemotaxis phosphatase CheX-like domain-containing protein n=1 Tax=Jonesiaceae bacterium BS-20 TaxID=3120821 RepID=A0AAU7DY13_9MICO